MVELLVVILAVVPALFKNIEKAKIVDLESDISAIRSAALAYYADNSNVMPTNLVSWIKDEKGNVKVNTPFEGYDDDKKFASEIEGLSMPFGYAYQLDCDKDDCRLLYIGLDGKEISKSGIEKLKQDIGEDKVKEIELGIEVELVNGISI